VVDGCDCESSTDTISQEAKSVLGYLPSLQTYVERGSHGLD
jgi:hypothetical protein